MSPDPTRKVTGWREAAFDRIDTAVSRLMAAVDHAEAARLVLVLPPFASPDRPSLGLHVLARVAEAKNWPVAVVYANLSFAHVIGPKLYRALCHSPTQDLAGERIFRTACKRTVQHGPGTVPDCWVSLFDGNQPPFNHIQDVAARWSEKMGLALAKMPAEVVGLSTVFEQTLPSLALIEHIKEGAPTKRTLLGGANADDVMGLALADYATEVDHVFQGEAEASLSDFIDVLDSEQTQVPRIFAGTVNTTLDDLAPPQYETFFAQFQATVHEDVCPNGLTYSEVRLPYESSRGCWWGAKHHCTFCGLNANGMNHRIKAPDKVSREINALADRHDINRILMVDNIMPHSYMSTLLPALSQAERKLEIFYEQKANLSLNRMALLETSGVISIQPGIESLSTKLLKRMRKGSTVQTNIDCLRFALAAGVHTVWNLLSDFPGDTAEEYEGMIDIIPALHHLQPPGGVGGLSIDRFSPYHSTPSEFGIRSIAPLEAYAEVFPGVQDDRIAYHFSGDYDSAVRDQPDLHARLTQKVAEWEAAWKAEVVPMLFVFNLDADRHIVVDTRAIATNPSRIVDTAEAHVILRGSNDLCAHTRRALDQSQLLHVDGRYLSIACATLSSPAWDVPVTDKVDKPKASSGAEVRMG